MNESPSSATFRERRFGLDVQFPREFQRLRNLVARNLNRSCSMRADTITITLKKISR